MYASNMVGAGGGVQCEQNFPDTSLPCMKTICDYVKRF